MKVVFTVDFVIFTINLNLFKMKKVFKIFFIFLFLGYSNFIYSQLTPCNLTGGSVYVDHTTSPWMMNATVNGMSQYSYTWTNGAAANQTPFYSQWCVHILDLISGCDTIICQDCIPDSNAVCGCNMMYMPVCGCDGVMYPNSCVADCADVSWTPAVPSGIPSGFLPCNQPSSCVDSSLIDLTAICTMIWDPVCGCDSITYSNDCHALNFGGVTSWTQGPCIPTTSCDVEISGDSIICTWGTPQVLTASPANGGSAPFTYLWSNGQSNSPILTIVNPGTYCVTQTDVNGCIDTACITVTVQDIQIYSAPSPPIICLGDSIVLEIDTIGLSNIIWVPNTLITPPVHRIVDFPMFTTTYVVEAVDSAGCDRRGEIEVIIDSCITGIMHIMSNQVLIYPNPAKGNLTISMPKFEIFDLRIYDIMGRLVLSEDKISQSFIISGNTLSKGSYILHLSHAKGIITKKLMIE